MRVQWVSSEVGLIKKKIFNYFARCIVFFFVAFMQILLRTIAFQNDFCAILRRYKVNKQSYISEKMQKKNKRTID